MVSSHWSVNQQRTKYKLRKKTIVSDSVEPKVTWSFTWDVIQTVQEAGQRSKWPDLTTNLNSPSSCFIPLSFPELLHINNFLSFIIYIYVILSFEDAFLCPGCSYPKLLTQKHTHTLTVTISLSISNRILSHCFDLPAFPFPSSPDSNWTMELWVKWDWSS